MPSTRCGSISGSASGMRYVTILLLVDRHGAARPHARACRSRSGMEPAPGRRLVGRRGARRAALRGLARAGRHPPADGPDRPRDCPLGPRTVEDMDGGRGVQHGDPAGLLRGRAGQGRPAEEALRSRPARSDRRTRSGADDQHHGPRGLSRPRLRAHAEEPGHPVSLPRDRRVCPRRLRRLRPAPVPHPAAQDAFAAGQAPREHALRRPGARPSSSWCTMWSTG